MFKTLSKILKKVLGLVQRPDITHKYTQAHIKHVLKQIKDDHYDGTYTFGPSYLIIHYREGNVKVSNKDSNMSEEIHDLVDEILSQHQADSSF